MSLTKFNNDTCYMQQKDAQNKSIFDYVTDISQFKNKNQCADYTPPFLSYIPLGVPTQNIDIENDLKGMPRPLSKCTDDKYKPTDTQLAQTVSTTPFNEFPNNMAECDPDKKILPDGYYERIHD
ncbi:hypothetical protein EB118_16070 [bacterium]|nr:hypothetical protein [bacterium]NDD84102.1 hypothetical protein [bacterium]NDG31571.1 hypothetical protein [bacterium]